METSLCRPGKSLTLLLSKTLSTVVEHPHLFSRPHCQLKNLGFTDTLAAAFLSYLKYSFLTPALQKFREPGYSVSICHFCIFIWQGVPLLLVGPLARAPGGGEMLYILLKCHSAMLHHVGFSKHFCWKRLKAAPHSCIVSLWFMVGYVIPTVHYCTLKHY